MWIFVTKYAENVDMKYIEDVDLSWFKYPEHVDLSFL